MKTKFDARKTVFCFLIVFFAAVFVLSLYKVITYFSESEESESEFEEIREFVIKKDDPETNEEPQTDETVSFGGYEYVSKREKIDYSALKAKNPDFYGWIYLEGTKIDYPVMFTPSDPEYYLYRSFNKTDSARGVPFIDYKCFEGCNHNIIYSHNMLDKTMFGSIKNYKTKAYWEEHKFIEFDTENENGVYLVFASFITRTIQDDSVPVLDYFNCIDLSKEENFDDYIKKVKKKEYFDTGLVPEFGQKIITLSTCHGFYEDSRLCVVAMKVK